MAATTLPRRHRSWHYLAMIMTKRTGITFRVVAAIEGLALLAMVALANSIGSNVSWAAAGGTLFTFASLIALTTR